MTGLESLPVWTLAWIALVLAFAGVVHGTLGIGFPLVSTPLIAAATDVKTAVIIVVPPTLAVVIASIVRGPGLRATFAEHWRMPVWMFFGSLAGTRLFIAVDPAPLTLALAVAILVYLGLDFLGYGESTRVQRHRHAFGALFGFVAGVCEGSVNIAAPPLLIYFLSIGIAPGALVPALNLCFLTGKSTQLVTLIAGTDVKLVSWLATLPLCVVATATLGMGMRIRERVDAATYRRWLKIALGAMAAILFAQYLLRAS